MDALWEVCQGHYVVELTLLEMVEVSVGLLVEEGFLLVYHDDA